MKNATKLLLIVILIIIFETFIISKIKNVIEISEWIYLLSIIAFNVIMSLIISQKNQYLEIFGNINVLWSRMTVLTLTLVGLIEYNKIKYDDYRLKQVFLGILISSGIMFLIPEERFTTI